MTREEAAAAIAATGRSPAAAIAALGERGFARLADAVGPETMRAAMRHWPLWARPGQIEPGGAWRIWLIMAGRGWGKTRAGAEWVRMVAKRRGGQRIALVGATMHEARSVMIEGEAGLLAVCDDGERPRWEPSLGRLSWANGTIATLYSAAEPDSLRGPSHDQAWADEIAKWEQGEAAWDNLMLTLRRGDFPRAVATTTPRPVPLVRRLAGDAKVARSFGRMRDNRLHLPASYMAGMRDSYAGTRLGRQELDGELLGEAEGALWTREMIEACRVGAIAPSGTLNRVSPELVRVVIGVDPPAGVGGDACGIIVCGRGRDDVGYVLEDASVEGLRPEGWARAVARAAARWEADRVVAEANQGGAMVESVLRAADGGLPIALAHASRGKAARAEPVSMLYEQGRARHAGAFPALEDEMVGLGAGGAYCGPGRSPDRADALVWALSELMLGRRAIEPRVRVMG